MITMNLARIMYEGRRWSWRQQQHTYYEPNMSLKHFHFAQFYGFKKWKNKTMLHVHKIWCVVLLNITCHSGYTLLIAHVHVYTTFISSFIYLALISDVVVLSRNFYPKMHLFVRLHFQLWNVWQSIWQTDIQSISSFRYYV